MWRYRSKRSVISDHFQRRKTVQVQLRTALIEDNPHKNETPLEFKWALKHKERYRNSGSWNACYSFILSKLSLPTLPPRELSLPIGGHYVLVDHAFSLPKRPNGVWWARLNLAWTYSYRSSCLTRKWFGKQSGSWPSFYCRANAVTVALFLVVSLFERKSFIAK